MGSPDSSSLELSSDDQVIHELQARVKSLEQQLLEREQHAFERLDAIARSSEQLQTHYHKAIAEQADLANALEKCEARSRAQLKALDLAEHQSADLRQAYTSLDDRAMQLAAALDHEINAKIELNAELSSLRAVSAALPELQASQDRLRRSISDLDHMIAQSEEWLHLLGAAHASLVAKHEGCVADYESRLVELTSALSAEQAIVLAIQDDHHNKALSLESALSSAQNDYGQLLEKYALLEHSHNEQLLLNKSLAAANQNLNAELQSHISSSAEAQSLADRALEQLKQDLASAHAATSTMQSQLEALQESSLLDRQAASASIATLSAEVNDLRTLNESFVDCNQRLSEEVSAASNELESVSRAKFESDGCIASLELALAEAQASYSELSEHHAALVSIDQDRQHQLAALSEELDRLKQDLDQQRSAASTELSASQLCSQQLAETLSNAEQTIAALRTDLEEREALELAKRTDLEQALQLLHTQLADSRDQKHQLEQQCELLQTESCIQRQHADELLSRCELTLASTRDQHAATAQTLSSLQDHLLRELQHLGSALES
jgi:chromosome segregation ATPase